MPRIADTERIVRVLEAEGGSLGRRDILEALGMSQDRYAQVAQDLVNAGRVTKNRGRAGGLSLLATLAPLRRTARRGQEPSSGSLIPEPPQERELYAPFTKYLERTAKDNDESRSVIINTYATRKGKWETPDLTEVRVTPFPMIGQWELRVATYELKRQDSWSIESVLQTATYAEFAHESWLVVPSSDDSDWVEHFSKRVVDKAGSFGIGLATFDAASRTLQKHMTPQRMIPDLGRMHEWLEDVIDRLANPKLKTDIANNIAWARRKADAGRD